MNENAIRMNPLVLHFDVLFVSCLLHLLCCTIVHQHFPSASSALHTRLAPIYIRDCFGVPATQCVGYMFMLGVLRPRHPFIIFVWLVGTAHTADGYWGPHKQRSAFRYCGILRCLCASQLGWQRQDAVMLHAYRAPTYQCPAQFLWI